MPRLLSNVNSTGAVGITSDGTSLGNMTDLNFQSNRVKFDSNAGVATVYTEPFTVIGL